MREAKKSPYEAGKVVLEGDASPAGMPAEAEEPAAEIAMVR